MRFSGHHLSYLGFGRSAFVAGVVLLATASSAAVAEEDFAIPALPSGLQVEILEQFLDIKPDGELTYARFRFLAPDLAGEGAPDFEARLADMDVLCRDYALPHINVTPEKVDRIVISFTDRPTEFGVANPEATQFFESYSIENGACIWGDF